MATILLLSLLVLPTGAGSVPAPTAGEAYVYPSPATPKSCAKIVYSMQEEGRAEVRVYHEEGTLVVRLSNRHAAGLQVVPLDPCTLAPGMYLYRVVLRYDSGLVEKLKSAWFVVSP